MLSRNIRTCFVTGGTGFIGSHLVDHLLEKGCHVRCLIRDPSRAGWLEGKSIEFVHGDLESPEALKKGLRGVDAVFHLAGITAAGSQAEYCRVNAEGCRRLADAAMGSDEPPGLFLYVSSQAAVGPGIPGNKMDEMAIPAPLTAYGRSKLEGERLLTAIIGLPLLIVRPPAVYGARDKEMLPLFKLANRGFSPILNASANLSLIHVSDLVEGIFKAAVSGKLGETYFLANEDPVKATDLPDIFAKALGRVVKGIRVPSVLLGAAASLSEMYGRLTEKVPVFNRDKVKELTAQCWVCSSQKAKDDFSFTTAVNVEDGFRETAAWYREGGML